jgi:RNA polymerase sigma factor for flagellar operon FliA
MNPVEDRNGFISNPERLVYAVIKSLKIGHLRISREELAGYGFIGFMEAKKRFDPGRNTRFSTYAVHWIKGAIFKGISETTGIPRGARERWRQVRDAHDRLMQDLERAPTMEEISTILDISPKEVEEAITCFAPLFPDSLADAVEKGKEPVVTGEDNIEQFFARDEVNGVLHRLSSHQQEIIRLHYWDGLTFQEIAGRLGKEENAIKQTHFKAIKKLRKLLHV